MFSYNKSQRGALISEIYFWNRTRNKIKILRLLRNDKIFGHSNNFIKLIKTAVVIRCADNVTPLYPQKLALTSLTGGGRPVGIVRSRTKAMEFNSDHVKGNIGF